MSVVRSFRDLLENQCYNELYEAINEFVQDNPGSLDCSTRYVQSPDEATLSDLHIRLASIVDSPEKYISFYAIVEAELEIAETIQRNRETDEATQWFKVKCNAILDNGLHNLNTDEVSLYTKYDKAQKKCLSDALVPIIYKEELDEVAEDFLSRYYPETLKNPMAVDPQELAKRMGLTIIQAHLSKSCSVFGQTCFMDGETQYYDSDEKQFKPLKVQNGTILIDPDVFFMRNIGTVNNTIVHECVHWDKHRKFFELEKLYNPEASAIRCQVTEGTNRNQQKSEYEWMEWHASSLAPRILMPVKTTLQKTKELIEKNRKLLPNASKIDILESVIYELSDFFGVSKLAAKIRLIDLGYQEAIGVMTYVNERYISNYAFEEGALQRGQTYTIGALDALIESRPGTKFRELLQSGQFLYVDAHFCINDPKYIMEDEYGFAHLTDYALMHIDECCIAFEIKKRPNRYFGIDYYTECVLYRDILADALLEVTYGDLPQNATIQERANVLKAEANRNANILRKLPATFGDTLVAHMERLDVTEEKLEELAQVSVRTIQRMRNEIGYKPKYKTLIAVCIGLHLPPMLSKDLIRKSGVTTAVGFYEDIAYEMLLDSNYRNSIYECNEILRTAGISPLIKEQVQ